MLKLWQNPDFIIKDAAIADKRMVAEILFFFARTRRRAAYLCIKRVRFGPITRNGTIPRPVRAVLGLTAGTRVTEM